VAAARPTRNTRLAGRRFVGLEVSPYISSMLSSGVGAFLISSVKANRGVNEGGPVSSARGIIIIVNPASIAATVYMAVFLFICLGLHWFFIVGLVLLNPCFRTVCLWVRTVFLSRVLLSRAIVLVCL